MGGRDGSTDYGQTPLPLINGRKAPPGLVGRKPVPATVLLNSCLTVIDTEQFIRATLRQIEARLAGDAWKAGNWSLPELMERLEAVGVTVTLPEASGRLQ